MWVPLTPACNADCELDGVRSCMEGVTGFGAISSDRLLAPWDGLREIERARAGGRNNGVAGIGSGAISRTASRRGVPLRPASAAAGR